MKLPAEGRTGPTPKWPLAEQSDAEVDAWIELWETPQAVAWEKLGWSRTVARYCRVMLHAEHHDATAAMLAEARQMEDRLGLTPKSMRSLMWEIVADEVGEKRQQPTSVRSRIKAV